MGTKLPTVDTDGEIGQGGPLVWPRNIPFSIDSMGGARRSKPECQSSYRLDASQLAEASFNLVEEAVPVASSLMTTKDVLALVPSRPLDPYYDSDGEII